jgi:hypothetical protein
MAYRFPDKYEDNIKVNKIILQMQHVKCIVE